MREQVVSQGWWRLLAKGGRLTIVRLSGVLIVITGFSADFLSTLGRTFGASIARAASAFASVDAALLSHDQHGDNLDPAGRALLSEATHILTTPASAQRLGGKARGVSTW